MDGHTVVSTVDGQEALDLVKTDRAFDVVLMDLQYVACLFSFLPTNHHVQNAHPQRI